MSDMSDEQMNEALAHDAARKGNGVLPGSPTTIDVGAAVTMVPPHVIAKQLDSKVSLLAKSTALTLVNVAQQYAGLAMGNVELVEVEGEQVQKATVPKPHDAEKLLAVAAKALEMARAADTLGDRAIVRADTPETTPAKVS